MTDITMPSIKGPMALLLLLFCVVLVQPGVKGSGEAWLKSEKHADLGSEIQLPCILKLPQCIGLHSIKWYQGNERIFVYSAEGAETLATDEVASRMSMIVPKDNVTKSYLKITNLTLDDEALYKCEVTYLAVNRECNNVQHITLNVTVAPTSVRVVDESTKQTLEDGRVLGPVIEGSSIALRCESGKGRPVPTVEWYNGNTKLKSKSSSELEEHEIGTGSGTLNLVVARSELGATFSCKVSSLALAEPLKIDIKLDVHVRPMKMDIKGVVGHVIQGSKVLLQCEVQGARPPANVTWYNGTEILHRNSSRLDMYETKFTDNDDGTTQTNSFLAFTASEHDNGRKFSCMAINPVMLKEGSQPMKDTVIIEVMYPPIVRMNPSNITVNETEDFQLYCEYEANPATLINVVWQRDGKNLTLSNERYEGGTTELTALLVKNATAEDIGKYTCILENDFGTSSSKEYIDVSVLFRPIVEVTMEPSTPINEAVRSNVSLSCDVVTGNPVYLVAVRWYLDGELLKELPDCTPRGNATVAEEFCDIDPSKLLLESVGRSFHGNYSCEGKNDAGWGPISTNKPLIVHYKPGPASISYEPRRVVKKRPLNITCVVKDPGRPAAAGFKWFRGSHRLTEITSAVYRIEKARLEYRANYTCMAYNEAGDGDPASIFVNISSPPAFIKKLPQLKGFVFNATSASLDCHVECSPLCEVVWMKNNKTIDFARTRHYYVENRHTAPNLGSDDFESINSSLHWNLTAWTAGQLDRETDNDVTFTCMSTSNGIGPGVASTVKIEVYFPPENVMIPKKSIDVTEENIPEAVTCNAMARPDPQYRWYREDKPEKIVSEDSILSFKQGLPRSEGGTYVCQASNKIGSATRTINVNVQYKPECHVDKVTDDGKDYVVCSAEGNPPKYEFRWSLSSDNDTIETVPVAKDGKSYLPLDDSVSNPRTYVCIANNTIGPSNPCERHVPAHQGLDTTIPWWLKLDGDLLVIVIATTVIIILVIIVICVVIFLMCRRKHTKLKYPSQGAHSNHMDSVSEGLSEPETKTFYENLPFHGIQSPPNKTANSIYDYKEHYQQVQQQPPHQQVQQQEMQQYGYPLPSNSSSQMTLPLTRSLYHSSSVVSPLQSSYMHSQHSLNAMNLGQYQSADTSITSNTLPYSLDVPDLTYDRQQHRRHTRRKHRSKRKRNNQCSGVAVNNETTSFELGMPESYKISYPHYYEDAYASDAEAQPQQAQQQQQQQQQSRKPIKRYNDELCFLSDFDVGREIDV
ncbi:hemicentin-1 isoform X2 [Phymastichus coffea]|uniref:hemicentin-1 isoform X2 n=1 Tax=Phymastichus coffea TaxID=108790 RepID=UPI00273B6802|nr:hemicentin-1 isoform X2 [Phymastichus coffea]